MLAAGGRPRPQHPASHNPKTLAWKQGLPAFIEGEGLGADDRHHIVGSGQFREVNTEIIIRQPGMAEGGLAGEHMQPGGRVDKQPAAIADQAIEGAALREFTCESPEFRKQAGLVLRVDPSTIQLLKHPTKGCLTVRISPGQIGTIQLPAPLEMAVVGKDPVLTVPKAMEGMTVLQGHSALGGLADVGDRTMGLQRQPGHLRGHRRKGRRRLFPIEAHPLAIHVETGQPPAIPMVGSGATAPPEAMEGKAEIGRGVGAEGQELAHAPIVASPHNGGDAAPAMTLRTKVALGLLVFVPLSIAAERLEMGEGAIFLTSVLAILPLAVWLSTATEELALSLGPSIGALLNAVFGNATELIIALTALRAGLVEIVKASITGTVVANLLLALGLSMLVGGIGRQEQRFQPVVARVNGTAMSLAVLAILIPSLTGMGDGGHGAGTQQFSTFVAWVLLLVYGLTLLFSLRTHSGLYAVAEADLAEVPETHGPETEGAGEMASHKPPLLPWLVVLVAATAGVAYESELFVGVVEAVTTKAGLSALFTGVVLLPLLGGVAEYLTAVTMARKNKMDLSVSVALGSTLLVALLVVPILVLVGPWLGHPLDLNFQIYELVAIATAVVVSNLVSLDGRSDWLEGVLLLAAYVILAAGFYFQSAPLASVT